MSIITLLWLRVVFIHAYYYIALRDTNRPKTGHVPVLRTFQGNELNIGPKESNTTRLALAFAELRSVIADIWGSSSADKPLVIGPDVSWVHDQPGDNENSTVPNGWLKAFLQEFKPDAITFHHCTLCLCLGRPCLCVFADSICRFLSVADPAGKLEVPAGAVIDDFLFEPSFYANISANFSPLAEDVKAANGQPSSALWWGEGASEFHSGHKVRLVMI